MLRVVLNTSAVPTASAAFATTMTSSSTLLNATRFSSCSSSITTASNTADIFVQGISRRHLPSLNSSSSSSSIWSAAPRLSNSMRFCSASSSSAPQQQKWEKCPFVSSFKDKNGKVNKDFEKQTSCPFQQFRRHMEEKKSSNKQNESCSWWENKHSNNNTNSGCNQTSYSSCCCRPKPRFGARHFFAGVFVLMAWPTAFPLFCLASLCGCGGVFMLSLIAFFIIWAPFAIIFSLAAAIGNCIQKGHSNECWNKTTYEGCGCCRYRRDCRRQQQEEPAPVVAVAPASQELHPIVEEIIKVTAAEKQQQNAVPVEVIPQKQQLIEKSANNIVITIDTDTILGKTLLAMSSYQAVQFATPYVQQMVLFFAYWAGFFRAYFAGL